MIKLFNDDCLNLITSEELSSFSNLCIVTDPPFNIKYHYNTYKDNKDETEYYEWLAKILTTLNCPFVVIHYPEQMYKIALQTGIIPQKVVSWVYNSNTAKQHRDIAFFNVKPDFSQVRQPYKDYKDKRIIKLVERGITGAKLYDWWQISQVKNISKEKLNHPCQMPLEVMKNIIGILPKDFVIFDPFMGTGTTGLACKELGKDFIGCEIDELYFEIANSRINT